MGRVLAFDEEEGTDVEIVCWVRDKEFDGGVNIKVERENKLGHQFCGLRRRILFADALDEEKVCSSGKMGCTDSR